MKASGLLYLGLELAIRLLRCFRLRVSRLELAARGLDRSPCTLGRAYAFERHGLLDLAGQHDLGNLGEHRHHAGLLQRIQVDHAALDLLELVQTDLGTARGNIRAEAKLRQTAVERSLTTFEA